MLQELLLEKLKATPPEEANAAFKSTLFKSTILQDKKVKFTPCVGKHIPKRSDGSSSSGICAATQAREALREELHKLREERAEEREEFKRMKEEMDAKLKQLNEMLTMNGPSPGIGSCSEPPQVVSSLYLYSHVPSISSAHAILFLYD